MNLKREVMAMQSHYQQDADVEMTKRNQPLLQYIKVTIPEISPLGEPDSLAQEILLRLIQEARWLNDKNRQELSDSGTTVAHSSDYYSNKNVSDSKKTVAILTRANLIHQEPTATIAFYVPAHLKNHGKTISLNQITACVDPEILQLENLHSIHYPTDQENPTCINFCRALKIAKLGEYRQHETPANQVDFVDLILDPARITALKRWMNLVNGQRFSQSDDY